MCYCSLGLASGPSPLPQKIAIKVKIEESILCFFFLSYENHFILRYSSALSLLVLAQEDVLRACAWLVRIQGKRV